MRALAGDLTRRASLALTSKAFGRQTQALQASHARNGNGQAKACGAGALPRRFPLSPPGPSYNPSAEHPFPVTTEVGHRQGLGVVSPEAKADGLTRLSRR